MRCYQCKHLMSPMKAVNICNTCVDLIKKMNEINPNKVYYINDLINKHGLMAKY